MGLAMWRCRAARGGVAVRADGPGMPSETAVGDVGWRSTRRTRATSSRRAKAEYPEAGLICIDFTPVANGNAEWYAANGLPFVMGTTGGDREALKKTVEDAKTYCVIAPNMAKQIVALQAALEGMAADPSLFAGCTLTCDESHQSSKVDTSGTAKALSATLGNNGDGGWGDERIVRVRDVDSSAPAAARRTAACRRCPRTRSAATRSTRTRSSRRRPRRVPVPPQRAGALGVRRGTVDAAVFLARRAAAADARTSYTMIDVLRAGAMD